MPDDKINPDFKKRLENLKIEFDRLSYEELNLVLCTVLNSFRQRFGRHHRMNMNVSALVMELLTELGQIGI